VSEPLPERALHKLLAVAAAGDGNEAPLPARYQIVRELGRGGMGVVYEVHDQQLGRRCALKRIGAAAGAGDELRRRFAREALAAARLRHPHIAAVYDATPDYISMQLVAGRPIDEVPRGERRLLVELVRDAALALHHAHEQGIVHRDLKPSNLLVEGRHVFVVDFGLAKEIATDSRSLSGAIVGTPAFMPPEQALGRSEAIDARSDVYSLGATLHRCLTGAPPFPDEDLGTLLRRVVEDEPQAPGVDHDLDLVILKCLAKEPQRRYASALELATDLGRWLADEPVEARRPSIGYRLKKLLQRRSALLRAAALAALAAVLATALVLLPITLREGAARAAADEAVALSERATAVLQDAAGSARLGDVSSANETLDGGIAEAREFLARHEVARVRHVLGRLLRARGQNDEALAELELAIEGGALAEARFERGLMRAAQPVLSESERRAAIQDLSTPIGSRSVLSNLDLLFGRAELQRLQGNLEQARQILEEVLAYDMAHVGARTSLMRIALRLGDDRLAQYYSASASNLGQGYGPIFFAREQRRLPRTILGLEAALCDFTPQQAETRDNVLAFAHRGLVNLRRAVRLHAEGNRGEALAAALTAVEDHDAVLVFDPDLPGALNNRAVCLQQVERFQAEAGDVAAAVESRARAQADLARALAADPQLPDAHCNTGLLALRQAELLRKLGRVKTATQRLDGAITALQEALRLAPQDWPHLRACRGWLERAEAARRAGG
jgi:tetratricopeptide (TPR) repeat protein/predicted Ser/Thr protein kinase